MKRMSVLAAVMIAAMSISMQGQTDGTAKTKDSKPAKHAPAKKEKKETETEKQLREMHEQMQAQQAQIDALKAQLAGKDSQVVAAQQTAASAASQAAAANTAAASASAAAQQSSSKVDALSSTVADLKTTNAGLTETVVTTQKQLNDEVESPLAIHYKGITITPVAFFAAEGVWRQHSVNSDINTPFNSIPFPSAPEGHVSEMNFSGRQSRLGAQFQGMTGNITLTGYAEMDFLGTGTSSNNNQSNSYVLRQRQIWGRAETKAGFTVAGGQMWSLVTENRRAMDARTEIQPMTIDSQYTVGYNWTRQPSIRISQKFGELKTGMFAMGLSIEEAQITSFTANGTNPAEYFFAGPGQNGGLYNAAGNIGNGNTAGTGGITTYANNVAPDLIVKAAFDVPTFHFEFGGIGRWMRDYYYPVTTTGTGGVPVYSYASTYVSHTSPAGGVFGSARVYLAKFAEVAVQGMAGTGVGRYGSSQLADATLRPDETLEPVRNYHGLLSLETHPAPKLDLFGYYGGEYAQRTVYTTAAGNLIGYGPGNLNNTGCFLAPVSGGSAGTGGSISPPSTCSSPTRYIQEYVFGLTYRPYSSPKYGRLQYMLTYSYLNRSLWTGIGNNVTSAGPHAEDSMIHASMRYYIP